jgi:hypothetical protein
MAEKKNFGFDLTAILSSFELNDVSECLHLQDWLNTSFALSNTEKEILEDLYLDIRTSGEYMNEEELKTRMVGLIFYASKIDVPNKIRVFYERPLAANVNGISLSVITDCMVATPLRSSPFVPYFFLQVESNRNPDKVGKFKKAKGEKRDPEAQMLSAMLIAQSKNNDNKPIYGSYMIGTSFHFTTLIGKNYCVSDKLDAVRKDELFQIVFILRKLKELILIR